MKPWLCYLLFEQLFGATRAAYRHFDGSGNNAANPAWGSYGTPFGRIEVRGSRYVDGIGAPIGTGNSTYPSARHVSNTVMGSAGDDVPNVEKVSNMLAFWGQFMAHDIIHVENNASESFNIGVPSGDPVYDPGSTGTATMKFTRINYTPDPTTHERVFHNKQSAWVDGSQVYGADDERAAMLRTFSNGLFRTYKGNLLPFRPESTPDIMLGLKPRTFLAGDVRANENPALLSIQTLFMREHNRRAAQYLKLYPNATDEALFQMARTWVVACIQKVTYSEYLPRLLGQPLPAYKGYNASIDPAIDMLFWGASFRYGHSAISPIIPRLDEKWAPFPKGHLILRDAITNPAAVVTDGIEPILRGLVAQLEQAADVVLVDDLRQFMPAAPFGLKPQLFFDLAAFNIQRGRDIGLPSYNECRKSFGLTKVYAFADITADEVLQKALYDAYEGNIDNIEPYVGGLAEDAESGLVGPLFKASIMTQFMRLRDGDAFWYQLPDVLNAQDTKDLNNVTLSNIILWNTDIAAFPESAFSWADATTIDALRGVTTSSTSTGTTQGSAKQTVQLTTGLILQYYIDVTAKTVDFVIASNYSGWFAFGIGDTMTNADMYAVYEDDDGTWSVHDLYSTSYTQPPTDVSQGCTNDITNMKDVTADWSSTRAFAFTRKLSTGDACDKEISSTSATLPVIFAYSSSDKKLAYHGAGNRFQVKLNIRVGSGSSGSSSVAITDSHDFDVFFRIWHAGDMLLILFVMIPVGIYIARYGKRADLWLGWHKFFMSFALGEFAFTLRHIAVSYDEFILKMHTYDHIKIGVATACVGIAGGTVGFLAQKDWRIFARYSQGMRSVHKLGSYLTYVLGILNGWYGVQDLAASYGSTSKIWPSLYLGYFGLLVVILLGIKSIQAYLGDFANRFLDRFLQSRLGKWVERNTEENVGVVQFTEDVQIKEPAREITLEDFEQSCMDGKPWILIGGLVMDLNGYFDQHPGGRRLLEDYVGMDATNAFLGKVKNGGIHMHSRFAMNKLSSLVIACLPKEKVTEMGRSILSVSAAPPALARRRSSIVPAAIQEASTSFEAKKGPYKPTKSGLGPKIIASAALSQPLLPPSDTGPRKFILSPPSTTSETSHTSLNTSASRGAGATLVEKTTVTAFNAPMPVRKFRFRLKQTIPVDIEPGDAVTLRLRDKSGTIHIREYTPIKSPNDDCIDLYIKIYPAGLVTAPLDEVAVGDLVDMTNPESHIVTPLIHPDSEDGCYPNVVMIAAGTGITPMLQILDFYRQFGQRNSQPEQRVRASTPTSARKGLLRSHLRLLWSNRSEEEMFLITELACMERAEQGSLRVSHILSSPSASWTGSKGRVTRQHIKEILPEDLKTLLDRKLPSVDGTADLEGGNLGRCNWVNEYPWDSLCIVVCGPPGFNTAVAEILESFHVPDNVLHVL